MNETLRAYIIVGVCDVGGSTLYSEISLMQATPYLLHRDACLVA